MVSLSVLYRCQGSLQKWAMLQDYLSCDVWAKDLCDALTQRQQYVFRFFTQRPTYHPAWIVDDQGLPQKTQFHWQAGCLKMPWLMSFDRILFYLLHELTHFQQDREQIFYIPCRSEKGKVILLSQADHIELVLFCEMMASYQSIHKAYQLAHEYDKPLAWYGALKCPTWQELAIFHQTYLMNFNEIQRPALFLKQWQQGDHVAYYQKQAFAIFSYWHKIYPHHEVHETGFVRHHLENHLLTKIYFNKI